MPDVAPLRQRRPRDRASRLALLTGPLGMLATGAFLLATQHGYLSVAGILASASNECPAPGNEEKS